MFDYIEIGNDVYAVLNYMKYNGLDVCVILETEIQEGDDIYEADT